MSRIINFMSFIGDKLGQENPMPLSFVEEFTHGRISCDRRVLTYVFVDDQAVGQVFHFYEGEEISAETQITDRDEIDPLTKVTLYLKCLQMSALALMLGRPRMEQLVDDLAQEFSLEITNIPAYRMTLKAGEKYTLDLDETKLTEAVSDVPVYVALVGTGDAEYQAESSPKPQYVS